MEPTGTLPLKILTVNDLGPDRYAAEEIHKNSIRQEVII